MGRGVGNRKKAAMFWRFKPRNHGFTIMFARKSRKLRTNCEKSQKNAENARKIGKKWYEATKMQKNSFCHLLTRKENASRRRGANFLNGTYWRTARRAVTYRPKSVGCEDFSLSKLGFQIRYIQGQTHTFGKWHDTWWNAAATWSAHACFCQRQQKYASVRHVSARPWPPPHFRLWIA